LTLPGISLVVPSLNQGRFLAETLESALGQGYPSLELLVQDGGSTDGTVAVLEGYRGRVDVVSESDGGQADAINRGLSRAAGEVLGYLNSDDLLLPGALEAVGRAFAEEPRLRLVYGRAVYVDERGREIGPCLTEAWSRERLADYCFVAQPAAFFRRSLLGEVGPFDVSLHHALDYDFWLRAAGRLADDEVLYLDRPLAACRLHAEAKTVAGWGRALGEIFDVVRRRTGYLSLWWCVAKWDHRLDGRSQATDPHPVPWTAYLPALVEFAAKNRFRPRALTRGLRGAPRAFLRRLRGR
jgi:glycosyltransferase involved in cell wall biosynthesis